MSIAAYVRNAIYRVTSRRSAAARVQPIDASVQALIRAHGDWLTLLATVLEREDVISARELADRVSDLAGIAATERPPEAYILDLWAAQLTEAADCLEGADLIH